MPQYRRGFGRQIAPTIYAEVVDNPSGDLELHQRGVNTLQLGNSVISANRSIKLDADRELQDDSGVALIAGDNSGNIDQLGLGLTYSLTPATYLSAGGTGQADGTVDSVTTETLTFLFELLIAQNYASQYLKLDSVQMYLDSGDNGNYITEMRVDISVPLTGGWSLGHQDTTDKQNGSNPLTYDTETWTLGTPITLTNPFRLDFDVVHGGSGTLTILGIILNMSVQS